MRLVQYNILSGGLGRVDPIAETLLYLNPDIAALCEANDEAAVDYLAKRLGLTWAIAESPSGPFHVALLSRWPIRRVVNLGAIDRTIGRAALGALIDTPAGELHVIAAHLTSGLGEKAESQRLDELAMIQRYAQSVDAPAALLGDLNTNAPHHPGDLDAAEPDVRRRVEADPALIRHDVIDRLTGSGWVDAHHHRGDGVVPHTFSTGYPATRLDYVFLSPALAGRITDAGVETGGFAPYCSDHFPIWVDLG